MSAEGSCPLNFCVDTMTSDKVVERRRYRPELKAEVMAKCQAPGASVAKVAMARGINANVVHYANDLFRETNSRQRMSLMGRQRKFGPDKSGQPP